MNSKRILFGVIIEMLFVVGCSTKMGKVHYRDNTGRYSVEMMTGEKNTIKDTLVSLAHSISGEIKSYRLLPERIAV